MNTFHLFVFSASQHQPIFLFYSALLWLFDFFYFLFICFGSNQASFEMLISLWKCCVFKYGVKLPRFGLQLFALTPPTRMKGRKKREKLREKAHHLSHESSVPHVSKMYLNVFGLIGLQIGWHCMFSLAFIHSCNFRGNLSYISLFFIHLASMTGFVLWNDTWVQSKLWLICAKTEDATVIRATTGSPDVYCRQRGKKLERQKSKKNYSLTDVWLQKWNV